MRQLTQCVRTIDIEEECSKPETLDDCRFEIHDKRLIDVTAIHLRQTRLGAKRLSTWQNEAELVEVEEVGRR